MNIYHNEPQRVTADPNPNRDARSLRDTNADTGELTPTFSEIADISLTAVKIPDICRFSRQVVTLCDACLKHQSLAVSRSTMNLADIDDNCATHRY